MHHCRQGSARTAPEKPQVLETRHGATLSGGAIRGQRCGVVAGMSLRMSGWPMT